MVSKLADGVDLVVMYYGCFVCDYTCYYDVSSLFIPCYSSRLNIIFGNITRYLISDSMFVSYSSGAVLISVEVAIAL